MKKIIMLLIIMAAAFSVTAQTKETIYFTAYKTEVKRKYKWQQEWETTGKNFNQRIAIALTGTTLSINADLATTFILDADSGQELETEKISAITFEAVEITNDRSCKIDIVQIKKTGEWILGVTYMGTEKSVAIHYFIVKNQ